MGAKPKQTRSAAGRSGAKRTPARRVPARKTANKARPRAGKSVDAYVAGLDGWQAEAAQRLRDVVRSAAPSLVESIKWGQPVYEDNGPVCYFRSSADHITFGFWRGTELDDPDMRLEGDGDRMKHVKIHSADEVTGEALAGWVRQGVDLNRRYGNPTSKEADRPEPEQREEIEMSDADRAAIPVVVPEAPVTSSGPIPASDDGWQDEFQP
ncbi:MAG TPA: DUF1801 domain-containing protein [Kofleriaceae bacterium]|nr:DUF1801 domain-containing protein [Kofleriaceae bacterium]